MVMQATGIGTLCIEGNTGQLSSTVVQFRAEVEGGGGSFVILRRPSELASMDAWGNPGDAVGLMRAVKQQLDPKNTLNPGRFVAGI
jgi:glycolate oxidase FAD binding subunit